jgi:hypothetical protein
LFCLGLRVEPLRKLRTRNVHQRGLLAGIQEALRIEGMLDRPALAAEDRLRPVWVMLEIVKPYRRIGRRSVRIAVRGAHAVSRRVGGNPEHPR